MWCRISLSFHSLHFYSVWFSSIAIPRIAVCLYRENKNLPTVHFPLAQPRDRWEIEQLIFLTGTQLNPVATVKKKLHMKNGNVCLFTSMRFSHKSIYMGFWSNHMITSIVSIQTYSALLRLYFIMANTDKEIKHDKHKLRKECAEKSKDGVGQASWERGK